MSLLDVDIEHATRNIIAKHDSMVRMIGFLEDSLSRALYSLHFKSPRNGEAFCLPVNQFRRYNEHYRREMLGQLHHHYCKFHERNGLELLSGLYRRMESQRATTGGHFSECILMFNTNYLYATPGERVHIEQVLAAITGHLQAADAKTVCIHECHTTWNDVFRLLSMPYVYFEAAILDNFLVAPTAFEFGLGEAARVVEALNNLSEECKRVGRTTSDQFQDIYGELTVPNRTTVSGSVLKKYHDTLQEWQQSSSFLISQQVSQTSLIERLKNIIQGALIMPTTIEYPLGSIVSVPRLQSGYDYFAELCTDVELIVKVLGDLQDDMENLLQQVLVPISNRLQNIVELPE